MAKQKQTDADLIPAVTYIRMSGREQEASPEQQRDEMPKLAAKHGCKIIREYFDPGISGDDTRKRKQFQKMIRDAEEKGDFAVILCWDQDRFGRFDQIEAGRWIFPLREAGVRLITTAQGAIDWTTFAGRLVYSVAQEGKHQFLLDLSRNCLRGRIKAAKNGGGTSRPPYGFDRLVYDEAGSLVRRVPFGDKFRRPRGWRVQYAPSEDAEILAAVRWMFETFANTDCSVNWLVSEMNARRPPKMPADGWTRKGIVYMLTNPAYIGTRRFGDRRSGKYHEVGEDGEIVPKSGKRASKTPVAGTPILTPGAHEGIIPEPLFVRVQEKLVGRKKSGRRPQHNAYLLSGLLKCGHCGSNMSGDGSHNGNRAVRYYRCADQARGKRPDCPCGRIQQDRVEAYVLAYVRDRLFSPGAAEMIRQAIIQAAKAKQSFKTDTKALMARIAAVEKKIARGTENLLLASPEDYPDMSRLLKEWRDEWADLQEQIELKAISPDGTPPEQVADRAMAQLARLQEVYKTGDPAGLRGILKQMIEEIPVWFEPYGKRKRLLLGRIIKKTHRGIIGSIGESAPCPNPDACGGPSGESRRGEDLP